MAGMRVSYWVEHVSSPPTLFLQRYWEDHSCAAMVYLLEGAIHWSVHRAGDHSDGTDEVYSRTFILAEGTTDTAEEAAMNVDQVLYSTGYALLPPDLAHLVQANLSLSPEDRWKTFFPPDGAVFNP